MNWFLTRGLIYLIGLVGGALAVAGLADFDPVTGVIDLRPFNAYAAAAAVVANGVAITAWWKGWGRR